MITGLQLKSMHLIIEIEITNTKRERILKEEFNSVFIRINPEEEDFNILKVINKMHRHLLNQLKNYLKNRLKNLLLTI